jgi:hypothetical protein
MHQCRSPIAGLEPFKPGPILTIMNRLTRISFLLVVSALCAGCGGQGSGPEKVVVEGRVTFDGTPIANGEVRFHPIEGTRGAVSGGPIRQGAYAAQGKGGVPVGRHRVEIQAFRPSPGQEAHPEGAPVEQYLPARFNESSTLTAEIIADTRTLDFELSSK